MRKRCSLRPIRYTAISPPRKSAKRTLPTPRLYGKQHQREGDRQDHGQWNYERALCTTKKESTKIRQLKTLACESAVKEICFLHYESPSHLVQSTRREQLTPQGNKSGKRVLLTLSSSSSSVRVTEEENTRTIHRHPHSRIRIRVMSVTSFFCKQPWLIL